MKRVAIIRLFSIISLIAILAFPSNARATGFVPQRVHNGLCPGSQVAHIAFETITPTTKIAYVTYLDGITYTLALRITQIGREQRIYFSLLEGESDIERFRKFSISEELGWQVGGRALGLASMHHVAIGIGWGSWISWDGQQVRLYVSHDLATQLILNLDICTVVTGAVAVICTLGGALACSAGAALMSLGCQLTSSAIQYWDALGNPGFYICATASPPRAWIEP